MAKEFAKRFYKSKSWRECRKAYVTNVCGLCERCLEGNKVVAGEELHHIKHLTPENINDPYISLNWDNLKFLCKTCHNEVHTRFESSEVIREGLTFDNNGNIIQV